MTNTQSSKAKKKESFSIQNLKVLYGRYQDDAAVFFGTRCFLSDGESTIVIACRTVEYDPRFYTQETDSTCDIMLADESDFRKLISAFHDHLNQPIPEDSVVENPTICLARNFTTRKSLLVFIGGGTAGIAALVFTIKSIEFLKDRTGLAVAVLLSAILLFLVFITKRVYAMKREGGILFTKTDNTIIAKNIHTGKTVAQSNMNRIDFKKKYGLVSRTTGHGSQVVGSILVLSIGGKKFSILCREPFFVWNDPNGSMSLPTYAISNTDWNK